MKTLLVTAVVIALASTSQGRVWITVYRCDETTPLATVDVNYPSVYRDIMVGTRLAIVVKSDAGMYWRGRLLFSEEDSRYFSLSGRRDDPNRADYPDSCLPAAGLYAAVWSFEDADLRGFKLNSDVLGYPAAAPGEWFIFDYLAEQVGSCSLNLYDLDVSRDVPVETLILTHVPSRDFDGDSIVNFEDFALLASYWRAAPTPDPNTVEIQYDLNSDGQVDIGDLILFGQYWLDRTDCNEPAGDPNHPSNP